MSVRESQRSAFGRVLRDWRTTRGLSQLELALNGDVSQRHISFLESGRAQPSRDMVLQLATVLDIPLREQNIMLEAAGFAHVFKARELSDPQIEQVRKALEHMLQSQPYPSVVIDRHWNLQMGIVGEKIAVDLTKSLRKRDERLRGKRLIADANHAPIIKVLLEVGEHRIIDPAS